MRELATDIEHDAVPSCDSVERREAHIAGIEPGEMQPVAATAWKQADVDNARHPRGGCES